MKRTIIIIAMLFAFGLGFALRGGPGGSSPTMNEAVQTATAWTCSMHPQIQLPKAGACPICGMDLIAVETGADDDSGPATLTLTDRAAALAEIETAVVTRGSARKTVRLTGILEPDQSRVRAITSHVAGRIEQLHVDVVGQVVRRGDPLFDVYSPQIYSAQEELLGALRSRDNLTPGIAESLRRSTEATVDAARERLRLWGMTTQQITALESRGTSQDAVTILSHMNGAVLRKTIVQGGHVLEGQTVYEVADLSRLWLMLEAYETDLPWLKPGDEATFTTQAIPGRTFRGTVDFVEPFLTRATRSVRVRLDVPNEDASLKPGFFVNAEVRSALAGNDGDPMLIPVTAPLLTGERAVVYVADPAVRGRFHGRTVVLGPRTAEGYVVLSGLAEGERVVTRGNFKIDSALQIRSGQSMMNPAPEDTPAHVPASLGRAVDARLRIYYQVAAALSHDEFEAGRKAADQLAGVGPPDFEGSLEGELRDAFEQESSTLAAAAVKLGRAETIEMARVAFKTLSKRAIRMVRRFGAGGSVAALVYHCPMADDNQGADWLQPMAGTENPYFGSSMFTCGSETDVLVPVTPHTNPESSHEHH